MKKSYLILLLSFGLVVNTSFLKGKESDKNTTQEHNQTAKIEKVLTIDLDKALQEVQKRHTKGKESNLIDSVIFIEENKQITFNGNILEKNSPVTIKISHIIEDNDENDEVSFSGNSYSVHTQQFNDGDRIIMQDKAGKVFVNQVIRRD